MPFRITNVALLGALVFAAAALWLLSKLRPGNAPADRSLIGKTGDITRTVEPGGVAGRIRIEGREHIARSRERIEAGSFGEVVAIAGSSVEVVQVPALSSHTTGYHMMEM